MKTAAYTVAFLLIITSIFACSEDTERENPFDAMNKRTGGAPPGLEARAGDSQITLSWPNLGFDGVAEYKIYRSYLSLDNFQQVAAVPAVNVEERNSYQYVDTGLENDGTNVYFYRLSYTDINGFEVPDPSSPMNLPEDWYHLEIIPSEAPPAPVVQVMEDTDLAVRLLWEGYSLNAPDDIAGYRIYSAYKSTEGEEQPPLNLIAEIDDPAVEGYVDGNDYPNNVITFKSDGVTKLYKVTAYDAVGVESDSEILEGTSPNLPPDPPAQVKARFALGLNTYEVRLEWRRNLEPDVRGYKIYALLPDGTREFKEWKRDPNETVTLISDRYVVFEGALVPKSYYITAYDNTKKPDGTNDESEPSEIMSAL
ncbi:hypothetical protein GF312_01460 [Candidatus Poribacteria bacterium]|nr:hypothetical protein [Candidatus Poribacteria bacterium]